MEVIGDEQMDDDRANRRSIDHEGDEERCSTSVSNMSSNVVGTGLYQRKVTRCRHLIR